MQTNSENHRNLSLHETSLFRWCIRIPTYSSIFLMIFVYADNPVPFSFKADNLSTLIETFQVPLLLLSLSVPLTALSAAIHRSEQTSRQISQQSEQNNFANHFKHLEEFKKVFLENGKLRHIKYWDSIEALHKAIYPYTIQGDMSPIPIGLLDKRSVQGRFKFLPVSYRSFRPKTNALIRDIVQCYGGNRLRKKASLSFHDCLEVMEIIDQAYVFSGMHTAPFRFDINNDRWIQKILTVADAFASIENNKPFMLSHFSTYETEHSAKVNLCQHLNIPEAIFEDAVGYFIQTLKKDEQYQFITEMGGVGWFEDLLERTHDGTIKSLSSHKTLR